MEITKEQIARFLSNRCEAAEARQIADYLRQNPSVLDAYFSEEEWVQFETAMQVDAATDREMWMVIQKRKQHSTVRKLFTVCLRVAAVLLICVAGWFTYKQISVKPAAAGAATSKPAAIVQREVILSNHTHKELRYVLEDSSAVVLFPNSEISYRRLFDTAKRDLYLKGEALFTVAKDPHRPFTVFSNGFSTTALGTSFRIRAYAADAVARIKLITGKVVVTNLKQRNNAIYLLPGEECAFDYAAVNLSRTSRPVAVIKPTPPAPVHVPSSGSIEETGETVTFNNTRLPEVMHKLGEIYGVRISYDTTAIQQKKFIGTVIRQNPVEDVLQTIAVLNDLQVTRKDDEFIITAVHN